MKNLFQYLILTLTMICLMQWSVAQQIALPQTTPDHNAAGAINPTAANEYVAVGNANGIFQFTTLSGPAAGTPFVSGGMEYFHQMQKTLTVIDMVYSDPATTSTGCNMPEGYYVTGNADYPGTVGSKAVFVARLDVAGAPMWYREFPIENDGTAKAVTVGVSPIATDPFGGVFVTGMISGGVPFVAALDACGAAQWGPYSYGNPNAPQANVEDITYDEVNDQVAVTGSEIGSTGLPSTWIMALNANNGFANWSNTYPVPFGSGDQGQAITTLESEIFVTGRATQNNNVSIYTLRVAAAGGAPVWQNQYVPVTGSYAWGEDITISSTGTLAVLGRDGASGNTILHELTVGAGFPAGAATIFGQTAQGTLRDQFVPLLDPTIGGYFITSNNAGGAGDYMDIWTPSVSPVTPDCEADFPVDFYGHQSVNYNDYVYNQYTQWETFEIYPQPILLDAINPCDTIVNPPNDSCVVVSDFCYDADRWNVAFTNNSSGNGSLTYEWDFGDGNTSTAANPTHTYGTVSSPTTYTVCLSVINTLPDGTVCCSTCCYEITINPPCYNNIPGPSFNYALSGNGSIQLKNTSGAGSAFAKTWTIDGTFYSSANQPPMTTLTPGTHEICLEITKISKPNCSEKYCRTIIVDEPCTVPLVGKFKFAGCINSTAVTFTNTTTGVGGTTTYSWDFGDGNTGTGSPVTHTYATNGTYMVCLTATSGMCSKKTCHTISVSSPSCNTNCSANRLANPNAETQVEELKDEWNAGKDLQVFPNPVKNSVNAIFSQVEAGSVMMTLSNLNGQLIKQSVVTKGQRNQNIDVSGLSSGMYILTMTYPDGKVVSAKVIKE